MGAIPRSFLFRMAATLTHQHLIGTAFGKFQLSTLLLERLGRLSKLVVALSELGASWARLGILPHLLSLGMFRPPELLAISAPDLEVCWLDLGSCKLVTWCRSVGRLNPSRCLRYRF